MKLAASTVLVLMGLSASAMAADGPELADALRIGETHVVVRHDAEDARAAEQIREALPSAVAAAERFIPLPRSIVITVYPTHEALEAASHRANEPWMRAWARSDTIDLQSPRTWSRGHASDGQMRQLLAHELTHCALFQALGRDPHAAAGVPAWFVEGMATTSAGQRFEAGDRYAAADRAFRSLVAAYGEDRVRALLLQMSKRGDFEQAFREIIGVSPAEFEASPATAGAPRST